MERGKTQTYTQSSYPSTYALGLLKHVNVRYIAFLLLHHPKEILLFVSTNVRIYRSIHFSQFQVVYSTIDH